MVLILSTLSVSSLINIGRLSEVIRFNLRIIRRKLLCVNWQVFAENVIIDLVEVFFILVLFCFSLFFLLVGDL